MKYKDKFIEAFILDFNKNEFDVLSTEFFLVLDECRYMIKNLKRLSKPKRVKTSIVNFPSKGYLLSEPYGVTLVMSPWNYPLQLALEPLVGAIAAGNTVVLKPASYSKHVSKVIYDMFVEFNKPNLISVILGGRNENQTLLDQKFDYIFFTGGTNVGKIVLKKAAENLTPVSLELGGKSPCIVTSSADISLAAKRIAWGKFLNAGQTCVAPDFICVDTKVHFEFVQKVNEYTNKFYFTNGVLNKEFPHMINLKHASEVKEYIDEDKLVFGGKCEGVIFEPTILDNVVFEDKVMKQEIFGPIMPILIYDDLDVLLNKIKLMPKPLAFYFFSKNKKLSKKVMNEMSFGGACVNETIMHLTNSNLPFGGVGSSGMGKYHGEASFKTFSNEKSILVKNKHEINIKYPPINATKMKLFKKVAKIK